MKNKFKKFAGRLAKPRIGPAEVVTTLFIAVVAGAATSTGLFFLMFPELGALALDVFRRPTGKWAVQPFRLILSPLLMAFVGTAITQALPYHVLTIVLVVVIGLVLLAILRSNIAPAISAGVLPVVFGIKSWMYPISISGVLVALAVLLFLWKRFQKSRGALVPADPVNDADEVFESFPHSKSWWLAFFGYLLVVGTIAQFSGMRFILFPPLVVMAYEVFAHPGIAAWTRTPRKLPLACTLCAISGLVAYKLLGAGATAALFSMVGSLLVLGVLDVHMPPAAAVGLLPLVMDFPDWKFPLSVAFGTLTLSVSFEGWNRFLRLRG